MKISANIEISNRLLPSLNIRNQKARKSSLSVGKSPESNEVCILLQSNQDKTGTKYKVAKNILAVFTKFVNEGKATIRFIEPPHDLCIRCDPLMLKGFLKILRQCLENKDSIKTSVLPVASKIKSVKQPVTKLVIKEKSQYPTLQGFPRTVVTLQINGISWKRLDERILCLRHLKELDISNNNLTVLPKEIGLLHLHSLNLSHNNLGAWPYKWYWMLMDGFVENLQLLNLSHNNLAILPDDVIRLRKLVTLDVQENELKHLPDGIGRLKSLKYLNISHNVMSSLPHSITFLRLHCFDVSSNCFSDHIPTVQKKLGIQSLLEIAARRTVDSELSYTLEDLPITVIQYLNRVRFCMCRSACFDSYCKSQVFKDISDVSATFCSDTSGAQKIAKLDTYFCSKACVSRYCLYTTFVRIN